MRTMFPAVLAITILGWSACKSAPDTRSEPEPSEPVSRPDTQPPAKAALCIPAVPFMAEVQVRARDIDVHFCVERGTDDNGAPIPSDCWTVDLKTGALAQAEPMAPFRSMGDMRVLVDMETGAIKRCPEGPVAVGCTEMKPKLGKAESLSPAAAMSDDGKRVAYGVTPSDGSGLSKIVVEQLEPRKKLSSFKVGDESFRCPVPQFLGDDILYLNISVCAGPGALGEFRDIKGNKLGPVGPVSADGIGFPTYGHDAIRRAGDVWAFLETTGQSIVLQNVRTGKVDKTIALAPEGELVPFANPGESGWDKTPDGRIVVVGAGPVVGTTWVVDAEAGTYTRWSVPVCAAP